MMLQVCEEGESFCAGAAALAAAGRRGEELLGGCGDAVTPGSRREGGSVLC